MPHKHLAGAEGVPAGASCRRVGDRLPGRGLHQVRPAQPLAYGFTTTRTFISWGTVAGCELSVTLKAVSLDDRARAAAADNLQADYLRQCLSLEREESSASLQKHARMLTDCMEAGGTRSISHHRGRIRQIEGEIRSITQMIDALNARFPAAGSELG